MPKKEEYRLLSCTVCTQENCSVTAGETLTPETFVTGTMQLTAQEDTSTGRVELSLSLGFTPSDSYVFIWRTCGGENVLVRAQRVYSETVRLVDYTAAAGRQYTYKAVSYLGGRLYLAQTQVQTCSGLCCITQLTEGSSAYHRRRYAPGSSRVFDIDCQPGSCDLGIGTLIYNSETGQPSAVYTDSDFESGQLTVCLDRLGTAGEPVTSGLAALDQTRSFFAAKKAYLIKDNSGTTRIAAITSVSRSFDCATGLSRLTLGWTELCRVSDALVQGV